MQTGKSERHIGSSVATLRGTATYLRYAIGFLARFPTMVYSSRIAQLTDILLVHTQLWAFQVGVKLSLTHVLFAVLVMLF